MVLGVGGFGGQEFLEGLEGVWEESASGESNTTGGFEMGISTGKGEENMELSLEINGIDVRELDWSRVTLGKIKASIVEIWDKRCINMERKNRFMKNDIFWEKVVWVLRSNNL